jgi:ABC-type Fe3+/spermidine/putrescine transport system ATPase subunit
VADFVGSLSTFLLRVDAVADEVAEMRVSDHERLRLRTPAGAEWATMGATIRAAIRPERIHITAAGPAVVTASGTVENRSDTMAEGSYLDGTIAGADYVGPATTYRVETAIGLIACQQPSDVRRSELQVGQRVVLSWPQDAALALPGVTAEQPS